MKSPDKNCQKKLEESHLWQISVITAVSNLLPFPIILVKSCYNTSIVYGYLLTITWYLLIFNIGTTFGISIPEFECQGFYWVFFLIILMFTYKNILIKIKALYWFKLIINSVLVSTGYINENKNILYQIICGITTIP